MKYLSLFSGVGGFELGIQQAYETLHNNQSKAKGLKAKEDSTSSASDSLQAAPLCIGYSEIDKYAIQVYNKHFNHKNYGDITKINASTLPNFDLLVGGFPCQSFSIAGKRGGFNDTRGTLFFDVAKILKEKQPRLCMLENVKGLLSHEQGATFRTIISTLDELGYDCQWQVLNSKNFGVPQNRERVFIVGHLRGTSRPEVFPITGDGGKDIKQLIGGTQSERVYSRKGVSPTVSTCQGGNLQPKIISKSGKLKRNQNTAATLTGGGHSGGNHSDMDLLAKDMKIRRLTPKECERLQGFPDDWTKEGEEEYKLKYKLEFGEDEYDFIRKEISNTQRYKMCGNAVSVPVIKAIIKKLI